LLNIFPLLFLCDLQGIAFIFSPHSCLRSVRTYGNRCALGITFFARIRTEVKELARLLFRRYIGKITVNGRQLGNTS
jgi:hypothetical protein